MGIVSDEGLGVLLGRAPDLGSLLRGHVELDGEGRRGITSVELLDGTEEAFLEAVPAVVCDESDGQCLHSPLLPAVDLNGRAVFLDFGIWPIYGRIPEMASFVAHFPPDEGYKCAGTECDLAHGP